MSHFTLKRFVYLTKTILFSLHSTSDTFYPLENENHRAGWLHSCKISMAIHCVCMYTLCRNSQSLNTQISLNLYPEVWQDPFHTHYFHGLSE